MTRSPNDKRDLRHPPALDEDRPVCHRADQVKDENARLLYNREPGNALPIEIVDQSANDRHTAT
jgi:hypothetical protein